jgi:hypothetical protein
MATRPLERDAKGRTDMTCSDGCAWSQDKRQISSASGCISRSSSDIRACAASQPVRSIAVVSTAMSSPTCARAVRISGGRRLRYPLLQFRQRSVD